MAYYVFLVLACATIVFGLFVVLGRKPAICAVNLVGALFSLSGIYLLIGFPFLAALQLIVYVGAIMVLFFFVIMLLDLKEVQGPERALAIALSPIIAGLTLALLALGTGTAEPSAKLVQGTRPIIGGQASAAGGADLATALFSRQLLAFEALSLLLLAAIVGVIVFVKPPASERKASGAGTQ